MTHPPICKTFRKFGLIRFNEKGCSGKCEFFHPNGCRVSLRTKKCERSDCRFFHIHGTKISSSNTQVNPNSNQGQTSNPPSSSNTEQDQFQAFQKWQQTQSQYNPPKETIKPVFQKDQSSIENTLAEIMKQMAEMKAQIQNQNRIQNQTQSPKSGSSSQTDWRN